MKKSCSLIGGFAILLLLAACGKETGDLPAGRSENLVPVTVEAGFPDTKITLSDLTPVWSAGDQIGIFTTDRFLCPPFTSTTGGSSTTTFSGQKPEYSTLSTAFFPYDATATLGTGGLSLTLPAEQSGNPAEAVMVATGSLEDGFLFENVCSLVKVNIPSSLNLRKIELYRSDRVSGAFTVQVGSRPFSTTVSAPTTHTQQRASVSASTDLSGDCYLAVLPSTSTALQLALIRADGKVAFVNTTFKTGRPYTAGTVKNLGILPLRPTFSDAALLADPVTRQL